MTFLHSCWIMFVQCNKQFNLRKKVDLLLRLSCCIYGEQVWKLLSDFEGTSKKGKGKCYNNFDNGRKWEKNMKKKKKVKKSTTYKPRRRSQIFSICSGCRYFRELLSNSSISLVGDSIAAGYRFG